MKKYLRSLMTVPLAILLVACTVSVTAVQSAVTSACNIVADVTSITALVTANPAITSADAFAQMICQAFTQQAASGKLGGTAPAKGADVTFNVIAPNGNTYPIKAIVQ